MPSVLKYPYFTFSPYSLYSALDREYWMSVIHLKEHVYLMCYHIYVQINVEYILTENHTYVLLGYWCTTYYDDDKNDNMTVKVTVVTKT